ncbi:MAG: hypothetical protein ACI8V4_001468 [Ilumatobacter sp.]|jgi:hypothetical protein
MNVVGHRVRDGLRAFAFSKGAFVPIVAWLVALAIVALLLVASIVGFIASAMAGWRKLRSVDVVAIAIPGFVTAGDNIVITVDHNDRSGSRLPTWIDVVGTRDALDLCTPHAIEVTIREPGVYDHFELTVSTPGAPALVWWHRRFSIAIDPVYVARRAAGPVLTVDTVPAPASGSILRSAGPRAGEVDGARPWRPGENQQSIHWPSTMRSSEIIAHDHQTSAASQWAVTLNATPERLRYAIEEGLGRGHEIALIGALDTATHEGLDDSEPIPIRQPGDAVRWSALAAQRQNSGEPPLPRDFRSRNDSSRLVGCPRTFTGWAPAARPHQCGCDHRDLDAAGRLAGLAFRTRPHLPWRHDCRCGLAVVRGWQTPPVDTHRRCGTRFHCTEPNRCSVIRNRWPPQSPPRADA